MPSLAVALLAGAFASLITLRLMLRAGHRLPVAVPDHRTLHEGAIPRTGGLAIWTGFAVAGAIAGFDPRHAAVLAGLVLLFAIEDATGLSPWVRLAGQVAATVAFLSLSPFGDAPPAQLVGIALVVLWATNLYNFMDGSDGLAGLMTVIGFGTLGASASGAGHVTVAVAAGGVAVAAIPFLAFNWHPARIFLGDAGAVPLGFLAATLGTVGVHNGIWPAWFPVLVFLPFVVDATLTLLRRSAGGESPMKPHRDHCYQRLVQLGWGHAGTAVAYGLVMAACAVLAMVLRSVAPQAGWTALATAAVALTIAYLAVARAWTARGKRA